MSFYKNISSYKAIIVIVLSLLEAFYPKSLLPVETDNYKNVNHRAAVHISSLMWVEGEGLLCGMEI